MQRANVSAVTPRRKAPAARNVPRRARVETFPPGKLAQLLGVSGESVRKWAQAGCPRLDSGEFVVAEVVTWLRQRDVEAERAKAKGDDKPKTELNRKLAAEAELKELQLERERRESVAIADFDEALGRVVGGFASVAKGQLTRFEREIVRATTPADARVLTDRIHTALMEGAQGLADELDTEADALTEDAVA